VDERPVARYTGSIEMPFFTRLKPQWRQLNVLFVILSELTARGAPVL
jgi:hypothetical protein